MECNKCSPLVREISAKVRRNSPFTPRKNLETVIDNIKFLQEKCACDLLSTTCMPIIRLQKELNDQI